MAAEFSRRPKTCAYLPPAEQMESRAGGRFRAARAQASPPGLPAAAAMPRHAPAAVPPCPRQPPQRERPRGRRKRSGPAGTRMPPPAPACSHHCRATVSLGTAVERLPEPLRVVGVDVQRGIAGHLGERCEPGRDHRAAARHRLRHRQAEPLVARRIDEGDRCLEIGETKLLVGEREPARRHLRAGQPAQLGLDIGLAADADDLVPAEFAPAVQGAEQQLRVFVALDAEPLADEEEIWPFEPMLAPESLDLVVGRRRATRRRPRGGRPLPASLARRARARGDPYGCSRRCRRRSSACLIATRFSSHDGSDMSNPSLSGIRS